MKSGMITASSATSVEPIVRILAVKEQDRKRFQCKSQRRHCDDAAFMLGQRANQSCAAQESTLVVMPRSHRKASALRAGRDALNMTSSIKSKAMPKPTARII